MSVSFTIDTREFNRTMDEYMKWTSRDLKTVVNTKAFFIARGAVRETDATPREKIRRDLSEIITSRDGRAGPRGPLIINFRRGKEMFPGLYGQAMRAAADSLRNARWRSRAFIKSGWLPAIKLLEIHAERRRMPKTGVLPKTYGKPKGGAKAALIPIKGKVMAAIWNAVGVEPGGQHSSGTANKALQRIGGPALQRAFNAEAASMVQYIRDKMYERAWGLGIKAKR